MVQLNTLLTGLAGLASVVSAHPGHDIRAEAAERAAFMKRAPRGLSDCSAKLKARGLERQSIARRESAVNAIRQKRGLQTRMVLTLPLKIDSD